MSQSKIFEIKQVAEDCLLLKLAKKFDEENHHIEYDIHKNNINEQIKVLRELLPSTDLKEYMHLASDVLSSLLMLYIELQTEGAWNSIKKCLECSKFLNSDFERLYEISLYGLLRTRSAFNCQDIFEKFLEKLHSKLTLKEFKKYPSLIEVYCLFIKDLKEYDVQVSPMKTLPVALLLMDDYMTANKIKGLSCCQTILKCLASNIDFKPRDNIASLNHDDFTTGNYHEVIYLYLSNALKEKDLEITKLVLDCLLDYMRTLPLSAKCNKMDNLFAKILEEVCIESNFNRKVSILEFMNMVISVHGINCVKRKKKFNTIMIDNLSLCTNKSIREVILLNSLECLEVWIKHCWAAWNYNTDLMLLSDLLKTLHALDESEIKHAEKLQNLVVALICLCENGEQKKLLFSLQNFSHCKSVFSVRLEKILNIVCKV